MFTVNALMRNDGAGACAHRAADPSTHECSLILSHPCTPGQKPTAECQVFILGSSLPS